MNLRLFVALEPSDPVRRRLGAAQEALRRAAGRHAEELRWVPPDRLHLTLHFLGQVPEERLPAVGGAVAEAGARSRPLRLEVQGASGFPSARKPRVVFGGVGGELAGLRALVDELGRSLGPLGFPVDSRTFKPHFTFGRSREAHGAAGLGGAIASAASGEPIPWRADELVLFRSHPGAGGSRYEPLLRARLGPSGAPAR